jgi:hypothetical protein
VTKGLGLQFNLPDRLVPLEAARIAAGDASVQVFDDHLELNVVLEMTVTREAPSSSEPEKVPGRSA